VSDPSHDSTYEAERARACDTEQVNDTEEELDGAEEDLKSSDGPVAQGSIQPPPPPTQPPYEEGGSPGGAGGGAASEDVRRGLSYAHMRFRGGSACPNGMRVG